MSSRRRNLKNLWLNPSYQGKYIALLAMSCLLAMICYGSVFYVFVKDAFDTLMELTPLSGSAQANLKEEFQQTILILSITSLFFLVAVSIIGLVFSHKVAGPLFKINQVCTRINRGEKEARIRLRPGDHFKDVAEYLNYTFDKFQSPESRCFKVVKARRHAQEIVTLERLKSLSASGELKLTDVVVEFEREGATPLLIETLLKS